MRILIFLIALSGITTTSFAQSESSGRHPRAIELENQMTKDATSFLKGRFPDLPFMVVANLEPLHRYGAGDKPKAGEQLPYLNLRDEEILDEWDDPAVPLLGLMNRVKKVLVTVSIPSSLKDDEIAEVEASLKSVLNLVPARDEIKVQRRSWNEKNPYEQAPLYGFIAFILIAGLSGAFFISRSSSNRLAKAFVNPNSSAAAPAPMMSQGPSASSEKQKERSGGAQIRFNDSLKVREFVLRDIERLAQCEGFPTLQDMAFLENLGKQDPARLGAVLVAFPTDMQKKLFSLSSTDAWLEAFTEPGELDISGFELVQKMERVSREEKDQKWQQLLIQVWRMGDERAGFLKSLRNEEAFALLAGLPKSLAVTTARTAFPGSWASILDSKFEPKKFSADEVQAMFMKALQVKPFRDFNMLERYRHDRDLLSYLKTADPIEEREIYGAVPSSSLIFAMRPPFYTLLDAPTDSVKSVLQAVSLDEWALSMYNVSRDSRKLFEAAMSDKQRFMYREKLKGFDAYTPTPDQIGDAREKIARAWNQVEKNVKAEESRVAA